MLSGQRKLLKLLKKVQPVEAHPLEFSLLDVGGEVRPAFRTVSPKIGPPKASPYDWKKTVEILKELRDLDLILPSTDLDNGKCIYFILRHPAYHTRERFMLRLGEFLFKSVLVPVFVAFLTAFVTALITALTALWFKSIFGQ